MTEHFNVAAEIEKLDELRTKGVITQQEFDARKTRLLTPLPEVKKPTAKRPGTFLAMSVILISIIVGTAYGDGGISIIAVMFGLFFYLLPAFLAYQRAHSQRHAILLVNLFLGWSILGWIAALVWSVSSSREKFA